MKKLCLVLLCMLLLLSGCAAAGDAPGAALRMRDLYIGGLDMQGLAASFEVGHSGDAAGMRLTVSADNGASSEAVLAVADDSILIVLDGGAGETHTYVIRDPETVLPIQELIGSLFAGEDASGLPGGSELETMTDEELEAYMAQLEEQLQAMGFGEEDPQQTEQSLAQLERFGQLLEQCVTDGEPMEHDGETYETMNIRIGSDEMVELLDMLNMSEMVGEDVSLGQALTDAGVQIEVTGVIAVSEDGSKSAYGLQPVITTGDGDRCDINLTLQQLAEDGSVDLYADLSLNGEEQGAFSVNVNVLPTEDTSWLPSHADESAQLIDPADDATLNAFTDGLSDFLGQLSGTVIGASLGNGMINGLDR